MVQTVKRVNYRAAAKRRFRRAEIQEHRGEEGRFAFYTPCRRPMVSLFADREESLKVAEYWDRVGCCGGCEHNHEVVDLETGERLL